MTKYSANDIIKGIRNPQLIKNETGRWLRSLRSHLFMMRNGTGTNVMQKDWDNLIICDALRYDYFVKYNSLDGNTERIISKGAHSWEFMKNNFVGREHHDTVYVTANPHVARLSDDIFHDIKTCFDDNVWNDEIGTVLPKHVVKKTINTYRQHQNKRLIVHFMQPHGPHIGSTADKYRERLELSSWSPPETDSENSTGLRWDRACESDKISTEEIRRAYAESVKYILDHVESLQKEIDGKSVVTSDHGQMLGEGILTGIGEVYGHPHDLYTPALRAVPWFEMSSTERREVYSERPVETESLDERMVKDRLRDLGYAP